MMNNNVVAFNTILEAFASYDPRVWAGVITAVSVFVVEIILCKKQIIFSSVRKKIDEAKKEGEMIKAKRISESFRGPPHERIYSAKYEYTYLGKIKHKVLVSTSVGLPVVITMYYTKKSPKPVTECDKTSPFIFLIYIIPVLASVGVMLLLGYTGE